MRDPTAVLVVSVVDRSSPLVSSDTGETGVAGMQVVVNPAKLFRQDLPLACHGAGGGPVTRHGRRRTVSTDEETRMSKTSLTELAHRQLDLARDASSGRSAHTVNGGHEHTLRQTVIALLAGQQLHDHESGGEATLQVLQGRVRLVAGTDSWDGAPGDLLAVPDRVHRLEADSDAVVLLTVALQIRT